MATKRQANNGVHPIADLFPMLANDELAELAADIKERGLLHPIVRDKEGRILDGRNRLAACKLAGIEPAFTVYDGDDADGYALAVNIARRHLTKGQQAMVAARAIGLLKTSQRALAEQAGVSKTRIASAAAVIEHAPDLVDAVTSGATPLNDAYKVALERKQEAESTETRLAWLQERDPELAAKVVEGELTLVGAIAECKEREAQRESELRASRANLNSVIGYLVSGSIEPERLARQSFEKVISEFDLEQLEYAANTMAAVVELAKEKR
jgi:ParB/RepB/Spo0J family partition protein